MLPSAPTGLSALVEDGTSLLLDDITLTWDAPGVGNTPFTYRVERATNRLFTENIKTLATGLTNREHISQGVFSARYFYRVVAINSAGDGPESEALEVNIPIPESLPSAVRNLSTTFEDNSLIPLSWDIPLTGFRPIRYRVERATNSAFTQNMVTLTTGLQRNGYTDPGPTGGFVAGTTYYYRIIPINISGEGAEAITNRAITVVSTNVKPSAVNNLRIGFVDNTTVDLKWAAPSNGTTPITYTLIRSLNPNFVLPVTLSSSITDLVYSDAGPAGGFVNGRTYYYRITPSNAVDDGPSRSTNVTVIVTTPEPDPDTVDPYAPELPFE